MYRYVTAHVAGWFIPFRDSDHADSINVRLTRLAQALPHGIAAEPDPGRQLQEKAGGVTPAGLFSVRAGPDSSLRGALATKQSILSSCGAMDCFRLRQGFGG
jgi:hypothetical protein